jgi:hydroxypyruvate isomerase
MDTTRTNDGRFALGNSGGIGNHDQKRLTALRAAVAREIKPKQLQKLIGALYGYAMAGDTGAAKLLLAYLLGRPKDPAGNTAPALQHRLATGEGIAELASAYCAGAISNEQARTLLDLGNAARAARELDDIEPRIRTLENAR